MAVSTEDELNDGLICYHFTDIHFNLGESSPAWYIFTCVVNAAFSVIATLCNLLVLVAIYRAPSLHTPSGTLLFGLALSDLGVGLIVHPLFFSQILAKVIRNKPLFCEAGISVEITANALCIVSLLTVTAVSLDRYRSPSSLEIQRTHHYQPRNFSSRLRLVVQFTVWLVVVMEA